MRQTDGVVRIRGMTAPTTAERRGRTLGMPTDTDDLYGSTRVEHSLHLRCAGEALPGEATRLAEPFSLAVSPAMSVPWLVTKGFRVRGGAFVRWVWSPASAPDVLHGVRRIGTRDALNGCAHGRHAPNGRFSRSPTPAIPPVTPHDGFALHEQEHRSVVLMRVRRDPAPRASTGVRSTAAPTVR